MVCPKCKGKTKVVDVVHNTDANESYRFRKCRHCGFKFYTVEFEVDYDEQFRRNWTDYRRDNSKNRPKHTS